MNKRGGIFLVFTLVVLLAAAASIRPAYAAGILVNTGGDNLTDDGLCTLREAITNANDDAATHDDCAAGSGPDTITFDGDYTVTLTSNLPPITSAMTLDGAGRSVVIHGDDSFHIFAVTVTGNLGLNALSVRNGFSLEGGGVFNEEGTVTITNSAVIGNAGTAGVGGIYNFLGSLTIANSTVYGNTGDVIGGIANLGGTASIINSTFSDNSGSLGTIYTSAGCFTAQARVLMADGSTKSIAEVAVGDQVLSYDVETGRQVPATVTHRMSRPAGTFLRINGLEVTPEHPFATGENQWRMAGTLRVGDRILGQDGWTVVDSIERVEQQTEVHNLTVDGTHNYYVSDGDHTYLVHNKTLQAAAGEISLVNTIVTNTLGGGADCINESGSGSFTGSNNLIDDHASGDCSAVSDAAVTGLDGSPADNGGPTPTLALLPPSNAIDAGHAAACAAAPVNNLDQRGVARTFGYACDIGAYEVDLEGTQTGPGFVVNTDADTDDGFCDLPGQGIGNLDCSLREAMVAANNLAGANQITFDDDHYITLGSDLPAITGAITLDGVGQGVLVDGDGGHQIFLVDPAGDLTVNEIIFGNGFGDYGGGVFNEDGTVTITHSAVIGNNGTAGVGGIFNFLGSLTIANSTVYGNTGDIIGGVANAGGSVSITNSTFSDNSGSLGTIYTSAGCFTAQARVLMADGSTKSIAEVAVGDQVLSFDFETGRQVPATVTHRMSRPAGTFLRINGLEVTPEHPFATGEDQWRMAGTLRVGDRILGQDGWTVVDSIERVEQQTEVHNLTVDGTHNYYVSDGDHTYLVHNKTLQAAAGEISLVNTIVTNTLGGGVDCYNESGSGSFTGSNNLIDDHAGGDCSAISDAAVTFLDISLDLNGGSTPSLALLAGSNAIDAGHAAACAAAPVNNLDQRSVPRPQGPACDIGAYEFPEPFIRVSIGGANQDSYLVDPVTTVFDSYPSVIDGPVGVLSADLNPFLASQRVTSGGNYNELIGLPSGQFDTEYWFPWYDHGYPGVSGSSMRTWVLVSNPDDTLTADVDIFIGGTLMGSYSIPPGSRITPRWIGLQDGPVQVLSDIPVFASQRVFTVPNNSFNETLGYPSGQFTTEYWFPWYDSVSMDNAILVGNTSPSLSAAVDIYVGSTLMDNYVIPAETTLIQSYPAAIDGPVRVAVTNGVDIVASQSARSGPAGNFNAYNEVMGYPFDQFDTDYHFPWYDHGYPSVGGSTMRTWVLVGNPDDSLTADVDIFIGGTLMGSYSIPPGSRVTPRWIGLQDGPVQIVSDIPVFASERVFTAPGSVFNEMMAHPAALLTNEYWFPWYDSVNLNSDILIARP